MHRTVLEPPTAIRAPRPVREAFAALGLVGREQAEAHALVRAALLARGRRRRDLLDRLAGRREDGPPPSPRATLAWIPLVLAVRDEMAEAGLAPADEVRPAADALLQALTAAAGESSRTIEERWRRARRARHEEARGRALLHPLLDLLTDAALTLTASGRVGLWNRAGVLLTGRRRRDLARTGPAALFRDRAVCEGVLEALRRRSRVAPEEATLVNAAGEDVPVRVFAARLDVRPRGGEDDPERALLLFHDLTEVQRIRRRLIETENLSAMAKIAGSVAHEFRNPLNSLFLSADLLEDELAGSGALQEAITPTLAAIREEVERLNQIITHYLSLSKVASNTPEVVDLGATVRAFAEEWRAQAVERGIDLRVRVHDGDPRVSADPNQVRRVLVNLVDNAFDAIVEQEASARARSGVVTLSVRPLRAVVKLTVRDNGPGIPAAIRDRVLEAFFTSKAQGSGLGLYLVREIVLAHGGDLTLTSPRGRGTSVVTRWPRVPEGPRPGGPS
jgi:signal transduction histidine kinase